MTVVADLIRTEERELKHTAERLMAQLAERLEGELSDADGLAVLTAVIGLKCSTKNTVKC